MEKQPDGIWIIGADAKTVYANERMAEILGTSPSEMVGLASFAYVFPEDVDAAQRLFDAKTRGVRWLTHDAFGQFGTVLTPSPC